ncbi:MAG: hypothetical protein CVU41_04815 [Chloroflexi bacterium HGW-Chloroflexi-3]|nr:MAG: hypothetical protein CVU41_04815 [Chloroflexi bacterium HGW-Chloroflexi-3]
METSTFKEVKTITVNCKKSVLVRRWENDQVEARYPANKECNFNLDSDVLDIVAKSYLILSVPKNIEFVIERIYGNLETVGDLGKILIENVSGNCSIQSTEMLTIENISGNCKIGHITSNANIRNVGGNLSFIVENGIMEIHGVGGNLSGKADSISLTTSVGGNLKIMTNRFDGNENHLRAGGSIKLNISDLDNTVINARAGGIVSINYQESSEKFTNGKFEKKFGSGEKEVQLKAGGNIKISDEEADFEINQNFGSADDAYVDGIEQKFESKALQSSGFDFTDLFDIDGEISEKIREKTQMADEKIQKAMEKMERKFSFKEEFGMPRPPRPPRPPVQPQPRGPKSSPISTEEKMMILQMLQEKKITAEEADRLLRALEQS